MRVVQKMIEGKTEQIERFEEMEYMMILVYEKN